MHTRGSMHLLWWLVLFLLSFMYSLLPIFELDMLERSISICGADLNVTARLPTENPCQCPLLFQKYILLMLGCPESCIPTSSLLERNKAGTGDKSNKTRQQNRHQVKATYHTAARSQGTEYLEGKAQQTGPRSCSDYRSTQRVPVEIS